MNSVEPKHIGIGIDTARYGHHVSFMDDQKRQAAKPFHFTEDAKGYGTLHAAIEQLCQKNPGCVLHIQVDAAGQYAENLLHWLSQQPWSAIISVGQPARNKAYRKAHYDKRKADPIESLACARFAVVERPQAIVLPAAEFCVLRDAVAQMEASAINRARLVNQLHNMMARAFPELAVIVKDIGAKSILKMLQLYPTAERIAATRISTLAKLPHIGLELATKLHEAAKVSTAANRSSAAQQLIMSKVQAILAELKMHDDIEQIVQNVVKELPPGPHQRVRSIPGIGPQTEAALIAKIVTIKRFRSANALIGYFGVFPEEVDVSGVNKDGSPKMGKATRMSRKGNDLVRRLLYTAAQTAVKHNPPVRELFARLMAQGKDYNTAIGHCMAKILRQVFAVWTKDCDFDPNCENSGQKSTPTDVTVDTEKKQTPSSAAESVAGHSQAQGPSRKVVTATQASVAQPLRPLNFAELRLRVSMQDVLNLLGWNGRSSSKVEQRGPCPVHQATSNKETSFVVNVHKKAYCCHRCGSKGNALDLWVATQSLPLLEAGWNLAERLGIDPPLLK